jgi:hypothetical protein
MNISNPEDIARCITEDVGINSGLVIPGVPEEAQPKAPSVPKWQQQENEFEAIVEAVSKQFKRSSSNELQDVVEATERFLQKQNIYDYGDIPTRVPLVLSKKIEPLKKSISPPDDKIAINYKGGTVLVNSIASSVLAENKTYQEPTPTKPVQRNLPLGVPAPGKRILDI